MRITFGDIIDKRDTINLNYRSVYIKDDFSPSIITSKPEIQKIVSTIILHLRFVCGKVAGIIALSRAL